MGSTTKKDEALSQLMSMRAELDNVLLSIKEPDPPDPGPEPIEEPIVASSVSNVAALAFEAADSPKNENEEKDEDLNYDKLLLAIHEMRKEMVAAIHELRAEIARKKQWSFVVNRDTNQLITSVTANG